MKAKYALLKFCAILSIVGIQEAFGQTAEAIKPTGDFRTLIISLNMIIQN
jgi:hypothetical protein